MTYLPFADISISSTTIFFIGLLFGILEGVFGAIVNIAIVPVLNIFGFPLPVSASTSAGYCFGRTSLFVFTGNSQRLALCRVGAISGAIGLPGVILGFKLHLVLTGTSFGEAIFKLLYFFLIVIAAAVLFRQWGFFNRHDYYEDVPFPLFGLDWRFPPAIPGGSGTKHITIVRVALCGLLLGITSGFMGLGAGILGIPLFMYLTGLPERSAAATDTLAMLIIGAGTFFCYSAAGRVELMAVLIFLAAFTLGSRIGLLLPGEMNFSHARLAFSLMLGIVAASTLAGPGSMHIGRSIITISGLIFCASLVAYSLLPEKIWPFMLARLLKNTK